MHKITPLFIEYLKNIANERFQDGNYGDEDGHMESFRLKEEIQFFEDILNDRIPDVWKNHYKRFIRER